MRSCTCACTYVGMTYIGTYMHMRTCTCLACVGPAMRATRAYIHTYDVAAHCATVDTTPSLLGRDEFAHTTWVYVSCMCWASHEGYAGLHTH